MDLPQSIKNFRHIASRLTVIPFPDAQSKNLEKKKPFWKIVKKPKWLTQVQKSHIRCPRPILKTPLPTQPLKKSFNEAKKEIETEMIDLFNFLKEADIPTKLNLLDKFNRKINSGEIQTIPQMQEFLAKVEKLAECIKLYLHKNEYSENFMKDISLDVFEQGFNPKNSGPSNNP